MASQYKNLFFDLDDTLWAFSLQFLQDGEFLKKISGKIRVQVRLSIT